MFKSMKKFSLRFLMIAFLIVTVLFFYFSSGFIIDFGFRGNMSNNGWAGSVSWRMYPATIALFLSAAIDWLLFKRKNRESKDISKNISGERL